MHLRTLTVINFRNYERQSFDFAPGRVLLLGENAQGKTNVLEAIFVLATGQSDRASVDADMIAWSVREQEQPFAQISGHAVRESGEVDVEWTIIGRPAARGGLVASKRVKINGVAKRATDAVGTITAVLFTTDDMDLISGAPAGRRRYLDVMLSQADRDYRRALSSYGKVLTQRNALLKRIREGAGKAKELDYWDEELAREGSVLLVTRARAMGDLSPAATLSHAALSGGDERLEAEYEPRFSDDWPVDRIAAHEPGDVAPELLAALASGHSRDVGAGMTLGGPHRDDLRIEIDGQPAAGFASRGQQRTAALALRLAQARFLLEVSGERPLLLLDDVLSELDERRRAGVLGAVEADQVFITSADPDRFDKKFVRDAQVWEVSAGVAKRAS